MTCFFDVIRACQYQCDNSHQKTNFHNLQYDTESIRFHKQWKQLNTNPFNWRRFFVIQTVLSDFEIMPPLLTVDDDGLRASESYMSGARCARRKKGSGKTAKTAGVARDYCYDYGKYDIELCNKSITDCAWKNMSFFIAPPLSEPFDCASRLVRLGTDVVCPMKRKRFSNFVSKPLDLKGHL